MVTATIAFTAVSSYLAVYFDYPDVLEGRADVVLPLLLAMGTSGRAVWMIYSLLPLSLFALGMVMIRVRIFVDEQDDSRLEFLDAAGDVIARYPELDP